MPIQDPQVNAKLNSNITFLPHVKACLADEEIIYGLHIKTEDLEGCDLYKIDMENCLIEGSEFIQCNFDKASFSDVIFRNCDFSNSSFKDAYFNRCQFLNCKCIGLNLRDIIMKQITIDSSNFQFSTFDGSKLENVFIKESDFTESTLSEVKLKNFASTKTKFIKNNFFKTKLKGVDFTTSDFIAPTTSNPPEELRGAKINTYQAADLIRLMGVIVE